MNLRVLTPPDKAPISIEEAVSHLELTVPTDYAEADLQQAKLELFINAAREAYEGTANLTVHQTVYEYCLPCFPDAAFIELPRAYPLVSVASITIKDSDEAEASWSSSEWLADLKAKPGRIMPRYGQTWPSTTLSPASPISIVYTAGLAASPEVEAADDIKEAILMLVAAMYENREAEVLVDQGAAASALVQYGFRFYRDLRRTTFRF